MKYPFDIVSIVRNKTLSIEARFSREEEESPLKIFNHFSRYTFAVIANGKAAKCNVPINFLEEMKAITDICKKEYYKKSETDNIHTTPAYTKRFATGSLKGKTTVEVLIENENGKELLNEQYKWLKSNLEKFPRNKELMDAIIEASKIDACNLKNKASAGSSYTILDIGCRPLIRKKRPDGKCFCYEIKVLFDSTRNYPVSIMIKNYYAPVVKTDKGLFNVILKDKDKTSEISNEFSMTMSEWLNAVDMMELSKNAFYMINFNKGLALAEKSEKENIERLKA